MVITERFEVGATTVRQVVRHWKWRRREVFVPELLGERGVRLPKLAALVPMP